jgi:hypothetical protein
VDASEKLWQGRAEGGAWASFAHTPPPRVFVTCNRGKAHPLGAIAILRSSKRGVYLQINRPPTRNSPSSRNPCSSSPRGSRSPTRTVRGAGAIAILRSSKRGVYLQINRPPTRNSPRSRNPCSSSPRGSRSPTRTVRGAETHVAGALEGAGGLVGGLIEAERPVFRQGGGAQGI